MNLNTPIKTDGENKDNLSNKVQDNIRLRVKQITKNNQHEIIMKKNYKHGDIDKLLNFKLKEGR